MESPTTVLLISSNPTESQLTWLDRERREIKEGLSKRSRLREQFELVEGHAARPRDLHREILDCNPQIVHFSGRGDKKKGLALEDDAGTIKFVDATTLAKLFELFANSVQCVILNACYSKPQAESIAQHIPYVIGMSDQMEDKAAIEFAVAFYDALGAGRDIEFAYKNACVAIQLTGIPQDHIPILKTKTTEIREHEIREIRERCRQKILDQHSRMQLLNGEKIGVDQLYVDVWLLNRSPRTYQISPNKLLETFDLRNDRLGLGDRIKRDLGFEVAKAHPKLVILGKPGSGKTTFLKHLAMDWCKGDFQPNSTAVLIEFRRIQNGQWNLLSAIDKELGLENWQQILRLKEQIEKAILEFQGEEHKALQQQLEALPLQALLKQGNLLILMDGLDEVPTNELRRNVQSQLQQIVVDYPKNRFILTCRTQIITSIPDGFTSVEVADFNEEQIKQFVCNWFRASGKSETEAAQQWNAFKLAVDKNPALKELTVTPILLNLMCLVFQNEGAMPSQVDWLYKKGIKLLLSRWNDDKEIQGWEMGSEAYAKLGVEQREALLIELAAHKFEKPKNFVLFNQEEIAAYIADFLRLANLREGITVLKTIEAQHGLLIERADELWSFSHLTFQEHFTIRWLTNLPPEQLAEKISDQQWQERVKQLVKSQQPSDSLVQLIKQAIDQSVSRDPILQKILIWTLRKSESVRVHYKPAAIRAFYFVLAHALDLSREYTKQLSRARNLSRALDCAPERLSYLSRARNLSRALDLNLDLNLSRSLSPDLSFVDLNLDFNLNGDLDLNNDRNLGLNHDLDSKLVNQLEQLRTRLVTSFVDVKTFQQWWKASGTQWVKQLEQVMIQYRNLGHDWQLTDKQKQQRQRYYDAHRFLVALLQIEGAVSPSVRDEIEDTLLLPWEELQRRHLVN